MQAPRADIADPPVEKGEGEREQTAHRGAVNGDRRQQAGRALHAAADELLVAMLMLLGSGAPWLSAALSCAGAGASAAACCSSKAMARSTCGSPKILATPKQNKPAIEARDHAADE